MRWRRRALVLLALALPLGACAVVSGERVLRVPRERLQAELAKRLPSGRELGGVELAWRDPKLRMLAPVNRLGIDLAFDLRLPIGGRSLPGTLSFETGLRFEPDQLAVLLDDPQLKQFSLGEGEGTIRVTERMGAAVANVLARGAVHRFRPEELRYAGSDWRPVGVRVLDDAIELTLRRK